MLNHHEVLFSGGMYSTWSMITTTLLKVLLVMVVNLILERFLACGWFTL
jgi:hypothetical protein